jgi:hypothetical protein
MNLLSPTDRVLNYKFLLGIVSVLFTTLSLLIKADEVTIERSGSAVHGKSCIWWDLRSIHSRKRGSGALENEISQTWLFTSIYWAFFKKHSLTWRSCVSVWTSDVVLAPKRLDRYVSNSVWGNSLNDIGEFCFQSHLSIIKPTLPKAINVFSLLSRPS